MMYSLSMPSFTHPTYLVVVESDGSVVPPSSTSFRYRPSRNCPQSSVTSEEGETGQDPCQAVIGEPTSNHARALPPPLRPLLVRQDWLKKRRFLSVVRPRRLNLRHLLHTVMQIQTRLSRCAPNPLNPEPIPHRTDEVTAGRPAPIPHSRKTPSRSTNGLPSSTKSRIYTWLGTFPSHPPRNPSSNFSDHFPRQVKPHLTRDFVRLARDLQTSRNWPDLLLPLIWDYVI